MAEAAPLFRVHWLGTSSGLPTRDRDLSCLVVEIGRHLLLLDAGEGAQLSILRRGFNISAIEAVLVTHRHGDHTFGLPGLYGTLWLMGRPLPLLVGDRAVLDLLSEANRITTGIPGAQPTLELTDHAAPTEVFTKDLGGGVSVSVTACLLDHRVPSHGFRLEVIRRRPARVDTDALKKMGIPPGPVYGRLQQGEDVTTRDGRLLRAAELRIPGPGEGASFAYLTDTAWCQASIDLARDADLVSHEATFLPGQEARAREVGHSTAGEALDVLEASGARRMVLTHFSARHKAAAYAEVVASRGLEERVILAQDGLSLDVFGRPLP